MSDSGKEIRRGPAGRFKWMGILCFAVIPPIWAYAILGVLPAPPHEFVEKEKFYRIRMPIDTIVVGDSRVLTLSERCFVDKGWSFFNMGFSGVSPADMAIALRYAMLTGKVRRVVMGVSFEGMIERSPMELSTIRGAFCATPETLAFAAVEQVEMPRVDSPGSRLAAWESRVEEAVERRLLPVSRAAPHLRLLVGKMQGHQGGHTGPFGNAIYPSVDAKRKANQGKTSSASRPKQEEEHDAADGRNPAIYLARRDRVTRYRETGELAAHAKKLYVRVFETLRQANVHCVVFETGRTAEYQGIIDADPLLTRLQAEWRSFFRSQAYGGIKFLDAAAIRECFDEEDFLDAVHVYGPTADRLARRCAEELAALDAASRGPQRREVESR